MGLGGKEEKDTWIKKYIKKSYYRKQRPVAPKLPDPSTFKPQDIDSSDGMHYVAVVNLIQISKEKNRFPEIFLIWFENPFLEYLFFATFFLFSDLTFDYPKNYDVLESSKSEKNSAVNSRRSSLGESEVITFFRKYISDYIG